MGCWPPHSSREKLWCYVPGLADSVYNPQTSSFPSSHPPILPEFSFSHVFPFSNFLSNLSPLPFCKIFPYVASLKLLVVGMGRGQCPWPGWHRPQEPQLAVVGDLVCCGLCGFQLRFWCHQSCSFPFPWPAGLNLRERFSAACWTLPLPSVEYSLYPPCVKIRPCSDPSPALAL